MIDQTIILQLAVVYRRLYSIEKLPNYIKRLMSFIKETFCKLSRIREQKCQHNVKLTEHNLRIIGRDLEHFLAVKIESQPKPVLPLNALL